ncbi:MAG TPA: FAD-dependent oxidoreductase [Solirubrobacteraceae bacterium]|nr:FAD-dependent oxidoreductase [Solirubrobacteraceae bacterium]
MPSDAPVLVVGAGPAGLAAAIELARHGVAVQLVERRTQLSSHPRATVLSLRSMEIVRAWGLEAQVRARSVADVDWRMLLADSLAAAATGTALEVGYPSAEQSRMISPTEPACVAQDDVEPLLLEHLRAAGGRVALGTEVTALVATGGGATVHVRDVRTGAARAVHAGYVVAADGARSTLRRALGIELVGPDDLMAGFTTLFRAPLWDVVGPHRHVIYSVADGAVLPAGRDRWLLGHAGDPAAPPDARAVAELVRRRAGVPGLPVRIEQSRFFSAAAQIAETWRCGRVFLAGDAVHRVTPRGGTGLNLALHDGYDLGWKLAWVLRDWAPPALLDTYESDRRPVVEYTASRSADPNGSLRSPETEVAADLGGRIRHAWSGGASTLDLLAPGLTFFTTGSDAPPAARAPVTVRKLDPIAARAVGAPVLVRSDGSVQVAALVADLPERPP